MKPCHVCVLLFLQPNRNPDFQKQKIVVGWKKQIMWWFFVLKCWEEKPSQTLPGVVFKTTSPMAFSYSLQEADLIQLSAMNFWILIHILFPTLSTKSWCTAWGSHINVKSWLFDFFQWFNKGITCSHMWRGFKVTVVLYLEAQVALLFLQGSIIILSALGQIKYWLNDSSEKHPLKIPWNRCLYIQCATKVHNSVKQQFIKPRQTRCIILNFLQLKAVELDALQISLLQFYFVTNLPITKCLRFLSS